MEKEYMDEERRNEKEEPEFKNEFVENSMRNGEADQQQTPADVDESYESDNEPNGIDPKTIFEKGRTFLETPEEIRSQQTNRFGKEPNGIDPDKR